MTKGSDDFSIFMAWTIVLYVAFIIWVSEESGHQLVWRERNELVVRRGRFRIFMKSSMEGDVRQKLIVIF